MFETTLEKHFRKLKATEEKALITYITAGDPTIKHTYKLVKALVEGGADILELGVPFSDPVADGPTIQSASQRALKSGVTPIKVINMVKEIKKEFDIPTVLLTYYNPVFKMGLKTFFETAENAEVDGVIVPDLPVEEAYEYKVEAEKHCVNTIFLASPSTTPSRLNRIIKYCSGFLYLVSIFGVTGARKNIQKITIETVKKIHKYTETKIPLAVGFGVSTPQHVQLIVNAGAEGVIVGSAIIKLIEKNLNNPQKMLSDVRKLTYSLKLATYPKPLTLIRENAASKTSKTQK
ncbi:MAG: tryptophan synthase subunit alpha [Candidatus Odinarchaeia archaeon]